MNHPYIGITGFTNADQVRRMADVFGDNLPAGSQRKLMVGVMMSYKTLYGLPTKWSNIHPPKESLSEIFIDHPLVMNTLHYASEPNLDSPGTWNEAVDWCGPNLHALQLDICWPKQSLLFWLRQDRPNLKIVLQVGGPAFDQVQNIPHHLWMRLRKYGQLLDYVLLDKSMGTGMPLDADFLERHVRLLSKYGKYNLAVAGGLGPDTMPHAVAKLAEINPALSIDAEGQMRASGNAADPVDWDRAAEYVRQSLRVLN